MLQRRTETTPAMPRTPSARERSRKYGERLAIVACSAFIGTNVTFNAEASGSLLYHKYFERPTATEQYLSQQLSRLGRSVTVECLPLYDMYGNTRGNPVVTAGYVTSAQLFAGTTKLVRIQIPIIAMNQDSCNAAAQALHDAEHEQYEASLDNVEPLGMLTHEFEHIYGASDNEPLTECHNTQRLSSRLRRLGYPATIAAEMGVTYAMSKFRLPSYLSRECRPGGSMDLHVSNDYPLLVSDDAPNLP